MTNAPSPWRVAHLGRVAYGEALALQRRLVAARAAGALGRDVVLFVEHPPVFTTGRRGGRECLLVPEETIAARGIALVAVERGGFITYHGPGQAVVYPILHLPQNGLGVAELVSGLEEAMIRTAAAWGVAAGRDARNRGCWVGGKKIGSIGLAVRRGVSFHGLAFNVDLDLEPFSWIDPCGLAGVGVTSLARESPRPVSLPAVERALERFLGEIFGRSWERVSRGDFEKELVAWETAWEPRGGAPPPPAPSPPG
ncbi:MAG: lipoyl(octanoyl) transferase LipB [Desulfobacterales bacterium]